MEQQIFANGGVQYVPQIAVQYVYLDFDGELTSYNGEILTVDNVEVKDSSLTAERIKNILAELNAKYAAQNVIFVTERPTSADYSTIYIGKTEAFSPYGNFAGLAENLDSGNKNKTDKAFVMLDSTASNEAIISTIAHETDHLLGTLDHGGDGLDAFACKYFYDQTCTGRLSSQSVLIGNAPSIGCNCSIAPYHYYNDAKNLTIADEGCLEIYAGGLAINTTIRGGGVLYVKTGGTANNTIVYDFFDVVGGFAKDTIVSSAANEKYIGGEMLVEAEINGGKGFAINTIVNAGTLTVDYGGTVHVATINSCGEMYVRREAAAHDTIINSGGYMLIESGGNAKGVTVNPGGTMYISSNGMATNIFEQGGKVDVTFGAIVTFAPNVVRGVTLEKNNRSMTVHSNTIGADTTINSNGCMELFSKGVAHRTIVNSGGDLYLLESAIADVTTINSRGIMNVYSNSLAHNTTINKGGMMKIASGGEAKKTTINSSGSMYISSSCIANDTTVNSGGEMYVYRGGEVNNTTVNSNGQMEIRVSGTASKTCVNSLGSMNVGSGAVASCTTIQSGGTLSVTRGGVHRGSLQIEEGAVVSARYGSEIDFTISDHSAAGGYLINNISRIQGSPTYTITISENQANGTYKLAQGAKNFNKNITIYDDFWEYGTLNSMGESMICDGVTYTLKNVNGNLTLTIESDVVTDITNLQASENKISWTGKAEEYAVEISKNNFSSVLKVKTNGCVFRTYQAPQETLNIRVNTDSQTNFAASAAIAGPVQLISDADGNMDLFFAKCDELWGVVAIAQHSGIVDGWTGTNEQVTLAGKNKLTDIFEGSSDANVLVLTDDTNGDALFVDDVYSELPGSVTKQQARIAQIDEIRAGAGDDIVDMTSQRFEYVGDGVKIYGGLGNDTIWANNGENTLFGDAGNDRIIGGANYDVIVGGLGNDSLHGGGGTDAFCFGGNWGHDTVEQVAGGSVILWFEEDCNGWWDPSNMIFSDGTNSVKVTGVSAENVATYFGNTGMVAAGAFSEAASEYIYEDPNRGMLA